MKKKTNELRNGDLVKNTISGNFHSLESVNKCGSGYMITLYPASVDGNRYYADYSDYHQIKIQ